MPPNVEQRTNAAVVLAASGCTESPAEMMTLREDLGVTKKVPLLPPLSKSMSSVPLPLYKMAEVAEHNTKEDCWVVMDNRVYDITTFIDRHPGGTGPIVNMAGKDATDVFSNYHAARVYNQMLPKYLIGEVTDCPVYPHVADFRAARQQMLAEGLFETDMTYYMKLGSFISCLFICSLALSLDFVGMGLGVGSFKAHMLGAAFMGIFWQQMAGVGHDLGHSAITHDFHKDHRIASCLSTLLGLSVCWWKSDHNTHHVVCNAIEHDPNIQHMPLMSITPKVFSAPFWDTYHKKIVAMNYLARTAVSYQHYFFYPLMLIGRWNLYVQGIKFLLFANGNNAQYKWTEVCSLSLYFVWFFKLAFSMPTTNETLAYIMMSHGVAAILHVQIVLSHWSMETYKGTPYTNKETEWHLMQLRTTMNIKTHEWFDYMHIGLQFQIEHHLYPRLPRHNLRRARTLVKAICKKHDIHYHEPSFFEGNVEMFKAMKDTAMAARKTTIGDGGFYESKIYEGLNCSG